MFQIFKNTFLACKDKKVSDVNKMLSKEDLAWFKNQNPTSINGSVWAEYNDHGKVRRDLDLYARDRYLKEDIAPMMKEFSSLEEKLKFLFDEKYYETGVFNQYRKEFVTEAYKIAYDFGFKFDSFSAASQFFATGSMKTLDNEHYLETFEDRVVCNALLLGLGNEKEVRRLIVKILRGEYQPATPTWMNAGRVRRGEYVSCFLLNTGDSLAHIHRNLSSLAMLSKAGGGVSICLTNVRAEGAPIKGYKDRAACIIHIVKLMEREAAYANQLGTRKGAAVAWWNILHRDTLTVMNARKIKYNGDPDFILRTVNLGLVIPDIVMEKAIAGEEICLLDPYDVKRITGKDWTDIDISEVYDDIVARDDIRKKWVSAREMMNEISHLNAQSGMPFILFEGNANRNNPIKGRVSYSNLCSEILQISKLPHINEDLSYGSKGSDINCVLGSLGAYKLIHGRDMAGTVDMALRALNTVSQIADFSVVPSLQAGNEEGHPVGMGVMDYAAFLASEKIVFGSRQSKEFTDMFFRTLKFHALKTNCAIAKEKRQAFKGFWESDYANGKHLQSYIDFVPEYGSTVRNLMEKYSIPFPTKEDWIKLSDDIQFNGLYMRYMMAIAPTGNISYVRSASASMAPINAIVEYRRSGTTGSFYHLAPHVTDETKKYFVTAYEVDYRDFIDVYAAATPHVDQGISMTIYEPLGNKTTRWFNHARAYAWRKGIKTIYYVRTNNTNERPDSKGSDFKDKTPVEVKDQGCESCAV